MFEADGCVFEAVMQLPAALTAIHWPFKLSLVSQAQPSCPLVCFS